MDLRKEVGLRVRHLRDELSLERGNIAERSGSSPEMIAKIENGETGISFDKLGPLANALETTVSDLFAYAVEVDEDEDADRSRIYLRATAIMKDLRRKDLDYHVDQMMVTKKHRPRKR